MPGRSAEVSRSVKSCTTALKERADAEGRGVCNCLQLQMPEAIAADAELVARRFSRVRLSLLERFEGYSGLPQRGKLVSRHTGDHAVLASGVVVKEHL